MSLDSTFRKIRAGDSSARDLFFQENTGLIWACIRRYSGLLEKDDLFQLGAIGLLKAIDRFDPQFGVMFSTYAVPLIMGEIRRYLRDDGTIKVSRRLKEVALTARRLSAKRKSETGKEPPLSEVAVELDVDLDFLCQSLDATQPVLYFHDLPGATNQTALGTEFDLEIHSEHFALKQAIAALEGHMKAIIQGRFFQGKTQHEMSAELGISQAHVSRLEKRALALLRQDLYDENDGSV